MSVRPDTEGALRAAMERLTAGTAQRCDGELTVSNLAREAGVGRATAHRATEVIAELHRRRSTSIVDNPKGSERAETLRERIRHLESQLADAKKVIRAEDSELRRRAALLAQQVQCLTLENHRLSTQLAGHAKVRELHSCDRNPRS
ncbi:MAG: hypothetical protein ACR2LJ_09640 [Acidimicrobiales bacterium]